VWAFNVSLLAVRSPHISSSANYFLLPHIDLRFTKIITKHRDAAAVDFWRSRHLPDGTLIPLPKATSSIIYKVIIKDVYYDEAVSHSGQKLISYLPSSSLDPLLAISNVSSNLSSSSAPSFLLFHHFYLINNALSTSRRLRHQFHVKIEDVAPCYFCRTGQDSIPHIFSDCVYISNARFSLFQLLSLDLSPFFAVSPLPNNPSASLFPRLKHFISSLLLPASLAPLTLGAPLDPTFLINVPSPLIRPILAFNYAVWFFRKPALASVHHFDSSWLSSRIVDLSLAFLSRFKPKKRKSPSPSISEDPSIIVHNDLVETLDNRTACCYTDGSATPNPGPCGAATTIFLQNPDECYDAGISAGMGTNNSAELLALIICFVTLLHLFSLDRFSSAIIFCDSMYAIHQATSSKAPLSNQTLIRALRCIYSAALASFKFKLLWIRGHSSSGGNCRVDQLSRSFALRNLPGITYEAAFPNFFECCSSSWFYGFPLTCLPSNLFASSLPKFPWPRFHFTFNVPGLISESLYSSLKDLKAYDCFALDYRRGGTTFLGIICPTFARGSALCTCDPRNGKGRAAPPSSSTSQSKRRKVSRNTDFDSVNLRNSKSKSSSASLPSCQAKRRRLSHIGSASYGSSPFYDTASEPLDFKHSD
jgi:ribonuclease HI